MIGSIGENILTVPTAQKTILLDLIEAMTNSFCQNT